MTPTTSSSLPGNTSAEALLQLHDIHIPSAPGWWPPAPGWWLIAAITLILLYWLSRQLLSLYRRKKWRQQLLSEFNQLNKIAETQDDVMFVTEISRHLRQLALTLFPANDVANLTGQQWLIFLDQHTDKDAFQKKLGMYLIETPYKKTPPEISTEDRKQLIEMVQYWANFNTRQYPVELQ